MRRYIIRLDDACEKMHIVNWEKMESLLDSHSIKPLVGVIPNCEDSMMDEYEFNPLFWDKVHSWVGKGWTVALHGYSHVYSTNEGGLNPVNQRSEFAGEPLDIQKDKIKKGVEIFGNHGIEPKVFFAPSHTFDINTIEALKAESDIRIISDTVANKPYSEYGITFVPQQSGRVRKLPFDTVTFCYHPNNMDDQSFKELDRFISANRENWIEFPVVETSRKFSAYDALLRKIYFARRG